MSCEIDYVLQKKTKALAVNVSSAPSNVSTSRCQGTAFLFFRRQEARREVGGQDFRFLRVRESFYRVCKRSKGAGRLSGFVRIAVETVSTLWFSRYFFQYKMENIKTWAILNWLLVAEL